MNALNNNEKLNLYKKTILELYYKVLILLNYKNTLYLHMNY